MKLDDSRRPVGGLQAEVAECPLTGGSWYVAAEVGDGLLYAFEPGMLAGASFLTMDMLQDGETAALFVMELQEGDDGPSFLLRFGLLNQCSARLRLPLSALDQNRWHLGREGAWLKPLCGGDRVDVADVDRIRLTVERKGEKPVRWCQTPPVATEEEPPPLSDPLLPRGPLLDRLGQSTLRDWPGKSRRPEEVTARLQSQLESSGDKRWPDHFSRWGGWTENTFRATGFFRTEHDGKRWWLVDPEGHAFWSAGMDCVRWSVPAACGGIEDALSRRFRGERWDRAVQDRDGLGVDYHRANFIRAFGDDAREAWGRIALAQLRHWGFNTVANWSDWRMAAEAGFPYVRPLSMSFPRTARIYRDLPDVFSAEFERDAADYAQQLRPTAADPAMIGYFLMNEPTWAFAEVPVAEGVLCSAPTCATRRALVGFLRDTYGDGKALSRAWGVPVTFERIESAPWEGRVPAAAKADLEEFSRRIVRRLFGALSEACRQVAPNHLNLGARYYAAPPDWAAAGMEGFDVFSMNCYNRPVPPAEDLKEITDRLGMPALIGEWHFGALDAGLPASGIGRVRGQEERGRAFRVYEEGAAALPCCVGAHWFTLADQSALGRSDGENYNIGFVDICNRPYPAMAEAARSSHARLYRVAAGERDPFRNRPEYLPPVFY